MVVLITGSFRKWFYILSVLLGLCVFSEGAFAPAVDTFEAGFDPLPNSSIDGENGWTATSAVGLLEDPADSGNTVMNVRNTTADQNYKTIPALPNATASTLYFRFRINGGAPDINVGASDSSSPDTTGEQRAVVRFNNTALQVPAWSTLTNVTAGTWYQLWIIVNSPSDNRYEVFIADDDSDTPVQLSAGGNTDWLFRNGGTGDLITFFVNCNSSNDGADDRTLIDDIYVDIDAKNLADPRTVAVQPYLIYSGTEFAEAAANNGQVGGKIDILLANDSFYTNSPLQQNTHYMVSGVPAGLSFSLETVSTNELSATLTGSAFSHDSSDTTSLTLTFLNAAFVNSETNEVAFYQQEIDLIFDNPSPAGWQLIDNLESLGELTNSVPLDGTNQWISDHLNIVALNGGSSNNVAQIRGAGVGQGSLDETGCVAWKPCGKQHAGTNGTLFLRFRLQNTTGSDFNVGLTGEEDDAIFNMTLPDQAIAFGPATRIVDDKLQVRDDTNTLWMNIASNLVADIWYKLWITIDNPGDVWHAYIQGGDFTEQVQLGFSDGLGGEDTSFIFRSQTGNTYLDKFIGRGNGANSTTTSAWLDDIYIDLREWNLKDPTAPPTGTIIMIL
jgi:hypothetical protein